jgi:HAE1 family hydrophobic/amphiphilic exporter-1
MLLRPSPEKRGRFFTAFNHFFEVTTHRYMGAVNGSIRKVGLMMVVFGGLVVAMVFGFVRVPGGFVPTEDQGYLMVNTQLPSGASLERTKAVMDEVTEILLDMPNVRNVATVGGFSLLNAVQGSNYGMAFVTFDEWDARDLNVRDYMEIMTPRFNAIREGIVFGFPPPTIQGLGASGGFQMEIQDRGGIGLITMGDVALDLVATGSQSPLLTRMNQDLEANVPQIFVEVDREKVKTLDIPLQSVFNTLAANLGSAYVNDFNLFGRTWRVMAQADQEFRRVREDIGRLEVRSNSGQMIPIATLTSVRDTVGPQAVSRFNLFPSVRITGSAAPGRSSGEANDEIERIASELLPPQMGFEWSGVTQQEKAAGNLAPVIFGLAFLFGFLFLAAQYESWALPLAVMLNVPLAMLGAMGLTGVMGLDNNTYTQIGLVLLIGLSAKTAILIVEFAKQQREQEGKSVVDAASEAARLRFRPILMTAFSFILGVMPLVFASGAGAASRVSLGIAVFGGMGLATVLGVFYIPLLYVAVQGTADRLFGARS